MLALKAEVVRREAAGHLEELPGWSNTVIGDLLSGCSGTYRYLPETIHSWHGPEDFAALMTRAGLVDVRWRALTFGVAALHLGTVPETAGPKAKSSC